MIGFGLPSVIMTLPAPSILSFQTKQLWTGIQQGWPIWITLAQLGLTLLVSFFNPESSVYSTDAQKKASTKSLRVAYIFGILCSTSANLALLSFSALAYAFPVLFAAPYNKQLLPDNMIVPVNPFAPYQAQTLADGALWFLQWDLIVGTIATAVWGLSIRTAAKEQSASVSEWIVGSVKIAIVSAVLGPCGAAVVAVWGRDELVNRHAAAEERSVTKKGKSS
jgi:hypothetical protein